MREMHIRPLLAYTALSLLLFFFPLEPIIHSPFTHELDEQFLLLNVKPAIRLSSL